jgi:hypothetical protein
MYTLLVATDKGNRAIARLKLPLLLIALIITIYQEIQINRLLGPQGELPPVLMH